MPILAYKIALLALSREIQHSSLERRLSSGALFFVKNDVDSGSRSRPILLLEMLFLLIEIIVPVQFRVSSDAWPIENRSLRKR
jgi:hypothetical protein